MKRAITLGFLLLACMAASAALYKVNISRVDQDLYRTLDGLFIQTLYCYEFVYSQDAIYDSAGGLVGRLIFPDSGTTCEVQRVFR